jgi:hypothetical protein
MTILILALLTIQATPPQAPPRIVPGDTSEVKTIYRELKPGEERVDALLQRIECPPGRPVTFVVKMKDRVAKYQAPRLDAVEYISHNAKVGSRVGCGGLTPAPRVYLTWKTVGTAPRVVAVEFLAEQ